MQVQDGVHAAVIRPTGGKNRKKDTCLVFNTIERYRSQVRKAAMLLSPTAERG
jgi:hypothetical protein